MEGDALKKVAPGDELVFPATAYNAFVDAAEYVRRQNRTAPGEGAGVRLPGIVLIKNATGQNVDRFGVLGISDILISPDDNLAEFKDSFVLVGSTPGASTLGSFVVLLESLKKGADGDANNGAIGRALIVGVVPVKVYIVDTGHGYANAESGLRTRLKSSAYGAAQILWAQSGTGEKWALVRIGVSAPYKGVTFRVPLAYSSGDNGATDGTTGPQYAYTYPNPITGATVSAQQPAERPYATGRASPATEGEMYFDDSGNPVLLCAYEVWTRRADCAA